MNKITKEQERQINDLFNETDSIDFKFEIDNFEMKMEMKPIPKKEKALIRNTNKKGLF